MKWKMPRLEWLNMAGVKGHRGRILQDCTSRPGSRNLRKLKTG